MHNRQELSPESSACRRNGNSTSISTCSMYGLRKIFPQLGWSWEEKKEKRKKSKHLCSLEETMQLPTYRGGDHLEYRYTIIEEISLGLLV